MSNNPIRFASGRMAKWAYLITFTVLAVTFCSALTRILSDAPVETTNHANDSAPTSPEG